MNNQSNPSTKKNALSAFLARIINGLKSPTTILIILVILLLALTEGLFDVFEIGVGQIAAITNQYRPKVGPVWEREIHDELATQQLQQHLESNPISEPKTVQAPNFNELIKILNQNEEVFITRKNFLEIYSPLPFNNAQQIISPYQLFGLMYNDQWQQCSVMLGNNQLRIYFLDGDHQLIHDSYIPLETLNTSETDAVEVSTILDEIEEFQGRVVPAGSFAQAFNALSISSRVYIMNNPMQLIRWGDALKYVGISRYVVEGTVTIGFQVRTGISNSIVRYQANEIAAARLIEQLNQLLSDKYLSMPQTKERAHANE